MSYTLTEEDATQVARDQAKRAAARRMGSMLTEQDVLRYLMTNGPGFWGDCPYVREWPRGEYRPVLRWRAA